MQRNIQLSSSTHHTLCPPILSPHLISRRHSKCPSVANVLRKKNVSLLFSSIELMLIFIFLHLFCITSHFAPPKAAPTFFLKWKKMFSFWNRIYARDLIRTAYYGGGCNICLVGGHYQINEKRDGHRGE